MKRALTRSLLALTGAAWLAWPALGGADTVSNVLQVQDDTGDDFTVVEMKNANTNFDGAGICNEDGNLEFFVNSFCVNDAQEMTLEADSGELGLGTGTPLQEFHIADFDPTIRLEDTNTDGSIWDIDGNADFDIELDNTPVFTIEDEDANSSCPSCVGIGTANPNAKLHVNGDARFEGTFSVASSRSIKRDFSQVRPREVLARLAELPISEWRYRDEDESVRHMGPVAEDFRAAFGLGIDEQHVSPTDLSGVALAATQGLHQELDRSRTELDRSRTELRDAEAQIETLKETLKKSRDQMRKQIRELRRSRDELAQRLSRLEERVDS